MEPKQGLILGAKKKKQTKKLINFRLEKEKEEVFKKKLSEVGITPTEFFNQVIDWYLKGEIK